ncbi:LacI family DNA-binding transcriptional regulator [Streptomyces sp. WMMB 322]|uniref:LacI family DNA-binding transcriptional regulator n=1 Tax=Streptomyces sp. WMMB 322 TaxID=1286821 RepID=UPI000823F508|nr:transcriptional regulator, LacI family [Streptomyces sp. WMMB 322]
MPSRSAPTPPEPGKSSGAGTGSGSDSGTGSGSVTMAMVARRAGVSTQTVSNALNTPELLRPETLERVRRAVDEMGYRPHRAARSLRTRASRLIGFGIAPAGPGNMVLDRFLHALSETADAAGYRLLLFAAESGERELAAYEELLGEHGVDAFVLSNTAHGDPRQVWLEERGIPFVAFGRMWSEQEVGDWVDVDGAAGTEAAVERLVADGHRRIGFLGWPPGSGSGDDRAEGWRRALEAHGLPAGQRVDSVDDVGCAARAVQPLLDAGVTAVVAASDTLALGCYRAVSDSGGVPGREVSVVGFDDSAVAPLLSPALASVAQPLGDVGREAMRLLLARMSDPSKPPERVLLPPALVVRASLGAASG